MGQSFIITNKEKKQFLNPYKLPASDKFPSILLSEFFTNSITFLVCGSSNKKFSELKNSGYFASKYLGAWYRDAIDILGDYDEEAEVRKITNEFEDISLEVAALLFELEPNIIDTVWERTEQGENHYMGLINQIICMNEAPKNLVKHLIRIFGTDWKSGFYKRLNRR